MKISFLKLRFINSSLNLFLSYILLMIISYISFQYYFRVDLNKTSPFKLSARTIQLLESIDDKIYLTVLISQKNRMYEDIENLLKEYQTYIKNIDILWIDPIKNPSKTKELKFKYNIESTPVIIISNKSEYRIISEKNLYKKDHINESQSSFCGEQIISSSLLELENKIRPKVYFLVGHGEKSINDLSESGYSDLITILDRNAINYSLLKANSYNYIPSDASAIIIGGPKVALNPHTANSIDNYLNQGGRLFLMLDAFYKTGLEEMLKRWKILLMEGFVFDSQKTLTGQDIIIDSFEFNHPIIDNLRPISLNLPRAIITGIKNQSDGISRTGLLFSSDLNSWLEVTPNETYRMINEENGDIQGPIQIAVAVEKGGSKELDVELNPSKMVIVGDSDFISNGNKYPGNIDFFIRSLDWLLSRDQLIKFQEDFIYEPRIIISKNQLKNYFLLTVLFVPASICFLGFLILFWRKRK